MAPASTALTFLHQMGRGSYGQVYKALGPDGPVAIKALPSALASDTDRLARFDREAKLLAAQESEHGHSGRRAGARRATTATLLPRLGRLGCCLYCRSPDASTS